MAALRPWAMFLLTAVFLVLCPVFAYSQEEFAFAQNEGDLEAQREDAAGNYILLSNFLMHLQDGLKTKGVKMGGKNRPPRLDLGLARGDSGSRLAAYGEALSRSSSPIGPGKKRR